jgi:hypothetical protein
VNTKPPTETTAQVVVRMLRDEKARLAPLVEGMQREAARLDPVIKEMKRKEAARLTPLLDEMKKADRSAGVAEILREAPVLPFDGG